jgi:hypothetical protein
MAIAIAIVALLISVASLAFGIYQYRILHRVRVREKATSLLRLAQDLRRKSEDLKHVVDSTDDVHDSAEFLTGLNALVENDISRIVASKDTTLEHLFEIEQRLLPLELELDLLQKQVVEVGKFNEEVRDNEASKRERKAL